MPELRSSGRSRSSAAWMDPCAPWNFHTAHAAKRDQQRANPALHRERAQDDGLAQRLAADDERRILGGPAPVRRPGDEVAAAQAAPHLAEPGRAAEPLGEGVVVGRVGDVATARAGAQLPPVVVSRFGHRRWLLAGGELIIQCRSRTPQVTGADRQ